MPISQPPRSPGTNDPFFPKEKIGSVGVPIATSMAILDPKTFRPQGPNETGEIAISGPTVMQGYLENPDANCKAYVHLTLPQLRNTSCDSHSKGHFFLTGDIGIMDKDGFVTLTGRSKELIKKSGEQVRS